MSDAVVRPVPGGNPPEPGHCCVMVSNQPDIDILLRLRKGRPRQNRRVLMSRLTWGHDGFASAILGPFIGAPYAAMLLETLGVWGVREVIFLGWCGAVSPHVHTGDIIIPGSAFIDDGTSPNYIASENVKAVAPAASLQSRLKYICERQHLRFHEGSVWSTDAIFRETREKILHYQAMDVLAVEMEAAALFSVGAFRQMNVGCVLVVSDEVSSLSWKPGFRNPEFMKSRARICEALLDVWAPGAF